MPFIRKGSVVFGVIIGVGFGSIPIFLLAFAHKEEEIHET